MPRFNAIGARHYTCATLTGKERSLGLVSLWKLAIKGVLLALPPEPIYHNRLRDSLRATISSPECSQPQLPPVSRNSDCGCISERGAGRLKIRRSTAIVTPGQKAAGTILRVEFKLIGT